MTQFSDTEFVLIKAVCDRLGGDYDHEFLTGTNAEGPKAGLTSSQVYAGLASECFLGRIEGAEVEALRRVVRAVQDGEPFRRTPEFDELARVLERDDQAAFGPGTNQDVTQISEGMKPLTEQQRKILTGHSPDFEGELIFKLVTPGTVSGVGLGPDEVDPC